jgi:hypothetical protein
MDPISTIATAGNVIQLVDFAQRLVSKLSQSNGTAEQYVDIRELIQTVMQLRQHLNSSAVSLEGIDSTTHLKLNAVEEISLEALQASGALLESVKEDFEPKKKFSGIRWDVSSRKQKQKQIEKQLEQLQQVQTKLSIIL